jgi:hypothetical protein
VRAHHGSGSPAPGRVRIPVKKIRFEPNVGEEVRAIEQRAALNILTAIHRYAAPALGGSSRSAESSKACFVSALATTASSSRRRRTLLPSIASGTVATCTGEKPIACFTRSATPPPGPNSQPVPPAKSRRTIRLRPTPESPTRRPIAARL